MGNRGHGSPRHHYDLTSGGSWGIFKACLVIYDGGSQPEKLEAFLGIVECCRSNLEGRGCRVPHTFLDALASLAFKLSVSK